jgi:hypothetical protein
LEVSWKLHPHEDPRSEEADDDEDEAEGSQEKLVELRFSIASEIEDDESETADGEKEGAGETFHDILAVDSIGKEGDLNPEKQRSTSSSQKIDFLEKFKLTGLEWPFSIVLPILGGSTIMS